MQVRIQILVRSYYSPNFIRKHLLHNKNSSITLLLLNTFSQTTRDFVLSTLSYETLQLSVTQPAHPSGFGNMKKGKISVVGSCNGLVCLHTMSSYECQVVIWNPATRETKVVPKSNLPPGYETIIDSIEFGFDAKTNDYKIINLLTPFEEAANSITEGVIQSEVYSLSADSWKKGDSPLCCTAEFYVVGLNTYINGMAYWEASNCGWEGVLSFDMSDGVFLKTPLPDEVLNDSWRHFFLLNESIAMAVSIFLDDGMRHDRLLVSFDILLLLEVGVKESWTRLFSIGPFPEYIDRPLGFWKSGIMFLEKYVGQLVLYNPSTKQMTDHQIHVDSSMLVVTYIERQLVTYMESLVSVKRGNEFVEQDDC